MVLLWLVMVLKTEKTIGQLETPGENHGEKKDTLKWLSKINLDMVPAVSLFMLTTQSFDPYKCNKKFIIIFHI